MGEESAASGVQGLPHWQRPREKLGTLGAECLSDGELLALVLGCGGGGRGVLEVSQDLLRDARGLERLADLGLADLRARRGLGWAGACRVTALAEICRRMARSRSRAGLSLRAATAVHRLLRGRLVGERRERVLLLMLDARHRLLGERWISTGSLTSSVIHPREVFRPAVSLAAAAVVLVHNHPSGDPTPSLEDHHVTARLAEAGEVLGIPLLDHVIVAADGFRSFREEGWLMHR